MAPQLLTSTLAYTPNLFQQNYDVAISVLTKMILWEIAAETSSWNRPVSAKKNYNVARSVLTMLVLWEIVAISVLTKYGTRT